MDAKIRRRLLEYGLAILAVGVALAIRWLVDPIVGHRIPFPTILGAVAVAVGFGGLYPAILATILGYVGGNLLFVEPRGSLHLTTTAEWITLAGYLFSCFTVTLFGVLMRRAQRRHQEAARELAELNLRKDEFLATVAHELRNPLAPIRNALELLKSETPSRPEFDLARDMIDRQLDHFTRLIDDLVDMDRIARNQLELRTSLVSLNTIVERAADANRSVIAARQHDLTVTLPNQPLHLEADAGRLEQVVVNLLTNAVKFTPPRGRIEVVIHEEGGFAVLRVRDSGVGITSEALPRLFEMFFQADSTQRGLGIGLALVRQLIAMHGGTVSAHSAGAGQGSEFIVRLPLAMVPLRATEEDLAPDTSPLPAN